jgi:shikimate dehydrogenase
MTDEIAQRITGRTELLALIAKPIRHSHSPRMHNLALSRLGLDYAYLCFEVDGSNLGAAVDGLRALAVRGWNVSMPNKIAILRHLDRLTPAVEMVGARNTVISDGGVLTGAVTDGTGFMRAVGEQGVDVTGRKMTITGCGGAGTAITIQAALDGVAEIDIFNRRDEFWDKGVTTAATVNERSAATARLHDLADLAAFRGSVAESALLVNATSVGMGPLAGSSALPDTGVLREDLLVTDVVYAPARSAFLAQAEAAGCRCWNGLGMMFHQGAEAFRLWTGQEMPLDYVREHLFLAA